MGMKSRVVFVVGAGVGATIGIGLALRGSGYGQRSVRDEFQQSLEAILFNLLDMTPFENKPTDFVVQTQPGRTSETYTGTEDVMIDESSLASATGAVQ